MFLISCASDAERLKENAQVKVGRDSIDQAAIVASKKQPLPDLPSDCHKLESANLKKDDRVDVALLKYDRALGTQRNRQVRCNNWFSNVKASQQ